MIDPEAFYREKLLHMCAVATTLRATPLCNALAHVSSLEAGHQHLPVFLPAPRPQAASPAISAPHFGLRWYINARGSAGTEHLPLYEGSVLATKANGSPGFKSGQLRQSSPKRKRHMKV